MTTATSRLDQTDIEHLDAGPDDASPVNGGPYAHLLFGLADAAIRRVSHRETGHDEELQPNPSRAEVARLCKALISGEDATPAKDILDALARTRSKEIIYLRYLAAAARLLGDWWTEDLVSFTEVTAATGRIFEVLRAMSVAPCPEAATPAVTVIFASVPGEQHTLGIRMAADLFRGDGWEIALRIGLSQDDLIAEIARQPRCIVGLSVGGRHSLDRLSALVDALHRHCPDAAIVVSGQDIADIRPQLSALRLDAIADGMDEAREHIAALWDREMARKAGSFTGEARLRTCRS